MSFGPHSYLRAMSVVLAKMKKLVDSLSSDDLPEKIEPERGINLMFKLFLPFMDDYLEEEANYAETITKKYIDDWNTRSALKNIDHTARVTNQTRETFKRYLYIIM
jgi:recyclin-1